MVVKKDRQFLVFYLDDKTTVKYDLSTCQTIGKSGRIVQDLKSQLRGYSISDVVNSIEDKTYKNLLQFVRERNREISNIGTLLQRAKDYSRYEQIFSSGLEIERGEMIHEEIPRGLAKICKEHDLKLSNTFIRAYNHNPNMMQHLFSIDCLFLSKKDVKSILTYNVYGYEPGTFECLVKDYKYNPKALLKYLDYLCGYEAMEIQGWHNSLVEIKDYARMARSMSNKFEKYPKNFLTVHKITSRNYNRLKEKYDEIAFQNRFNDRLEKKIDEYVFTYPKATADIKDEAVQQGNCVASYISGVIEGKCDILFMRKADEPEQSLVTIEVRNNRVVQAKGKFNRDVTQRESEIIEKYNQYLVRSAKG